MKELDLLEYLAGPPDPPAGYRCPGHPMHLCNCRPGEIDCHEQGNEWCRLETPEDTPPGKAYVYRYAKGSTA